MVQTFRVYKGATVVKEGDSPLTITGVAPNTAVASGDYQVTRVVDGNESTKVDIPAFTTLPIVVTGVTLAPKTASAVAGTASSSQVTATVAPANASNKAVTYSVAPATTGLTVSNAGLINWTAAVPAGTYTTTVTTTDGAKKDTHVLTLTAPVVVVTGVTVAPKTVSGEEGTAGSEQLTHTVAPAGAANKAVTYSIAPTTAGLSVTNAGLVTWDDTVPVGTYTVTVTTTDQAKVDTSVLTMTTP